MIVDAHTHIFPRLSGRFARGNVRGLGYGRVQIGDEPSFQAFPPGGASVRSTPEQLLAHLDWAGVEVAVLLQNNFYGNHNVAVADAVRRWPDRFVGAMYLDPWSPGARATFRRWQDDLPIVKLATDDRFGLFALHDQASLADDRCAWLWPEMESNGMTLTLDLGGIARRSYETDVVADIAERHPRLKIVICHLAQPTVDDQKSPRSQRLWQQQVLLACRPNVWLDVSALPHKVGKESYPWPSIGRWIGQAVEWVGCKKILWGTDYPGLLTAGTYPQLLSALDVHLAHLSKRDRQAVLGANACAAYPIKSNLRSPCSTPN
jgi:hypothetical protein